MKIQGIGLPFSPHQSSCSNRKPKNFEWTYNFSEIQVWMDMHIPIGATKIKLNSDIKKYGWFCESREVVPYLQDAFNSPKVLDEIVNELPSIEFKKGDLISSHTHTPYLYAFTYVVNAPKGSSPLIFPTSGHRVKSEEGKLILWDARLVHRVPPAKVDGRCIIAGVIANVLSSDFPDELLRKR